jgi:hypothetical protein
MQNETEGIHKTCRSKLWAFAEYVKSHRSLERELHLYAEYVKWNCADSPDKWNEIASIHHVCKMKHYLFAEYKEVTLSQIVERFWNQNW